MKSGINWEILDDKEVMPACDGSINREFEVAELMREIENKIERFIALTGEKGKVVKKRWRDIKKSRVVRSSK